MTTNHVYKAIALDLDGTTLNDEHDVTDRTVAVLQHLSSMGVIICIATGRTTSQAIRYIHKFNLSQKEVPTIAFNGAYGCLVDTHTEKVTTLCSNPLSESSIRLLIQLADDLGLVLQYYNGETGDIYAVPRNESHRLLLDRYSALTSKKQTFLANYDEAISICLTPKALILTDDPDALILEAKERFSSDLFHIIKGSPHPYFVEFLSPGVNKSTGLADVASKIGIDLADIVAFGDGDNDKEMLLECGLGVAMKNAKELAKEHANIILEHTNHEDGVARFLEEMFANGSFSLI